MELIEVIEKIRVLGDELPKNELEILLANPEEAGSLLIKELDDVIENIEIAVEKDYFIQVYAMYVLGELKVKEASRAILQYALLPSDYLYFLLDDMVTERYPAILYQCFDGNIVELNRVIHMDIDQYVRMGLVDVMVHYFANDFKSRGKAMEYLKFLWQDFEFVKSCDLGESIIAYIEDYKFYELKPMAREIYLSGLIEPKYDDFYDEFIDTIYSGFIKNNIMTEPKINAISELQKWDRFLSEEDKYAKITKMEEYELDFEKADQSKNKTSSRKNRKIGRNDPCPCGSGKKYKKCCLNKQIDYEDTSFMEKDMEKWLDNYPTIDRKRGVNEMLLTDHYDSEAIEIDKYVYLALHRRPAYIAVDYDEDEFRRRQKIYLKKAKGLLELKMEKDGIDSYEEYDEKNMIHYSIEEWVKILD